MSLSNKVESLCRELVVVNNPHLLHRLAISLRDLPEVARKERFGGSEKYGFVYLHRDPKVHAEAVYECVVSPAGDAIASLYVNHPTNATLGELLKAREMLANHLAGKLGLSIDAIGIDDHARGRPIGLAEVSTGQLIDLLVERMGHVVLNTDSHVVLPN